MDERVFRVRLTNSAATRFGRLERQRVVACMGRRKGVKVWAIRLAL